MVDALGEEWMATWWHGLAEPTGTPTGETLSAIVSPELLAMMHYPNYCKGRGGTT